jgi:hypothetical protein
MIRMRRRIGGKGSGMHRVVMMTICLLGGLVWLAVLVSTAFNLVAVSTGLLAVLYLMGRR